MFEIYRRFEGTMPFLPVQAQAMLIERQEEAKLFQLQRVEDQKQRSDAFRAEIGERFFNLEAMMKNHCKQASTSPIRPHETNFSPSIIPITPSQSPQPPDPPDFNQFGQRLSKFEFPVFDGTLPDCWIAKVDRLFGLKQYGNEEMLDLISLSLEGAALKWFRKHRREFTDWTYIKRKLIARFSLVKSDPCVEPLKPASALQVPDSVNDVLLLHKMDSLVKEVGEVPQQSTCGNGEMVAHQLFDQMPLRKARLEFCLLPAKLNLRDWPKEESKPDKKKSHQNETFEVLSSLEPSRRCQKESLVVVNDLSSHLGCVIGKTIVCICDSEFGQDNPLDEEEFNRVWEPGGILIEHDKWKGLEKCYKHGRLMSLMHWLSSMWRKESKSREFDRLSACSCVDLKTWHCVKHETQQTDFHVWHRWKNKAEKLPATYALLELMMLGLVSFQPNKGNDVVGLVPKATVLREVSNCRSNDYGTIRHKLILVRDTSSDGYKEDSWSFIRFILKELCSAGYEWENETIKENFKELSKLEKDHKLLHHKAGYSTQYNDLKQLSTEPPAGHISSEIFCVGGVHGFEIQSKRLLVLNEIPLLNNDNKCDYTIKENWFHNGPMIRGVFHLQRPPELINLHGNLDFIIKVLVQWKEHPPDQFSQAFILEDKDVLKREVL